MQNQASISAVSSANSETIGTPSSSLLPRPQVIAANSPSYYASGVQLASVGNDVVVSFTRPLMGHVWVGDVAMAVAETQPVVEINMSIMTIKDLSIILSEFVSQYESQFGEIETDFTRLKAAEKVA